MPKYQVNIVDRTHEEKVDTLAPPDFKPTGEVKSADQAIADGDWLGSVNFWLYTRLPEPSIFCQIRSPNALWQPGKLDLAASGYLSAGELGLDGIRELEEELGITVPKEKVHHYGRRMFVSTDQKGRERKSIIEIFVAEYYGKVEDMKPEEEEVYGVVIVPLVPLLKVFDGGIESFKVFGIDSKKQPISYRVTPDCFPENFDDYPRRLVEFIALRLGIDDRYLGL